MRQKFLKAGGVFSLLWRFLLLLPITIPVGFALFFVGIAFLIVPPLYAVILFIGGHWVWGIVLVVGWAVAMYLLRHVYARLFEGIGGL
jgi:hypothetical protein